MNARFICCLLATLLAALPARAQEEPVQPPPIIIRAVGGDQGVIVTQAQGVQTLRALGGGAGFFPMGVQDPTQLLHQPQIHEELELVEGQVEKIRAVLKEAQEKQNELRRKTFTGGRVDRLAMAEYQERVDKLREETEQKVEEILLPHQSKRLKQVALHLKLQRQGTAETLTGDELAEAIGLDDEQKQKLRDKAQEVSERLRREYEQLRAEARKEILGELTPAQQKKLEELLGGEYKPRQVPWGGARRLVPRKAGSEKPSR